MKGRLNSAIIALVVINLAATLAVFVLAYLAGARSGGRMLWEIGSLHSGTLYLLLGAVGRPGRRLAVCASSASPTRSPSR